MKHEFFSTTEQAEGAIPNGSRVRKVNSQPTDFHQDGALGTVLGSLINPGLEHKFFHIKYLYFIEWDSHRGIPVAIVSFKIIEQ